MYIHILYTNNIWFYINHTHYISLYTYIYIYIYIYVYRWRER